MAEERIQKVLSNLGIMSRREADRLLKDGKIVVNDRVASPGDKIDLSKDKLVVNKKQIFFNNTKKYYMLNKPAGYICSHKDPEGRPVIFDLIKDRMYMSYIGRLDFNSEGLVIITNDGDLNNFLSKPANNIEREYKVKVSRKVNPEDIKEYLKPRRIDGKLIKVKSISIIKSNPNTSWIGIVLTEGINREIRKLCEEWGLKVSRLIRVRYGTLRLSTVKKGSYRELSYNEIKNLKNLMNRKGEKKFGKDKRHK